MFLEILQISQENTCVGVSFLIKLPPFLKNTSDGCFCIQLLGSPNWISIKIFKIFYCFILNSFFLRLLFHLMWNGLTNYVKCKYNRFWGVLTETFATHENCNAYYQNLRYWKSLSFLAENLKLLITTTISSFFPHSNVFLVEVSLQLGFNVQITCIWSIMKHQKIRLFSLHLHFSANPYIDILIEISYYSWFIGCLNT